MIQRFAVPVGAGLASALLFAVMVKGTPLAIALAYLAPMPIMIAALRLGSARRARSGGRRRVGVVVAVFDLQGALAFLLVVAAPAWIAADLRGAAALRAALAARRPRRPCPHAGWRGRHAGGGARGSRRSRGPGDADHRLQRLRQRVCRRSFPNSRRRSKQAIEGVDVLPDGVSARDVAEEVAKLAPLATATLGFLTLCANLYAAARSTALSHRLPRPWPDLPTEFVLPRPLAVVAVVAVGVAIALPEPIDQFAWVVRRRRSAPPIALQGLAVLHALSRGLPLRPLLIVALYFCCGVRAGWTLPLIALVGLVDSAVNLLRARRGGAPLEDLSFAITPNVRRERWK